MESILETKASTLLEFLAGLRGTLYVTFEEGTWAAWLYDLLKPHVAKVLVCNPRKNALLKHGSKSDKIDAHKLAEVSKFAGRRSRITSRSTNTSGRVAFLNGTAGTRHGEGSGATCIVLACPTW